MVITILLFLSVISTTASFHSFIYDNAHATSINTPNIGIESKARTLTKHILYNPPSHVVLYCSQPNEPNEPNSVINKQSRLNKVIATSRKLIVPALALTTAGLTVYKYGHVIDIKTLIQSVINKVAELGPLGYVYYSLVSNLPKSTTTFKTTMTVYRLECR